VNGPRIVGSNVMNVTVLRNDQSIYTREQAFGGNQLTQDIVSRYGMSPEEAVQQRLDGRPRPARLLQGPGEIVDHLLVAHVLALE